MYDGGDVRGDGAVGVVGVGALAGSDLLARATKSAASGLNCGGLVFRMQDGQRQWLARSPALFIEHEWSWTFNRSEAYPFAGYGCAEAVAEILRRNGQGDCYPLVCKADD